MKRDKPHWGARKIRELLVRRLDGDIRVPANIKPKRHNTTPTTPLPHGHPPRIMMDILRFTSEPMKARQIADELAKRCSLTDLSAANIKRS